ncbi:hypothetical protein Zmor_015871 [Zophobas morio]|uniref:Uncharacterized protein n=1 Tax=Zophobas morio TaxID=2755281 RepID=A0AA38MHL9_9CUCU|nr:hypothetical protein Zmor_015871 [Zophobas morio]
MFVAFCALSRSVLPPPCGNKSENKEFSGKRGRRSRFIAQTFSRRSRHTQEDDDVAEMHPYKVGVAFHFVLALSLPARNFANSSPDRRCFLSPSSLLQMPSELDLLPLKRRRYVCITKLRDLLRAVPTTSSPEYLWTWTAPLSGCRKTLMQRMTMGLFDERFRCGQRF